MTLGPTEIGTYSSLFLLIHLGGCSIENYLFIIDMYEWVKIHRIMFNSETRKPITKIKYENNHMFFIYGGDYCFQSGTAIDTL